MNKFLKLILTGFMLIVLGGCAIGQIGRDYPHDRVGEIRNGMTKAEVHRILGEPESIRTSGNTETWGYMSSASDSTMLSVYLSAYRDIDMSIRMTTVEFENGRVAHHSSTVTGGGAKASLNDGPGLNATQNNAGSNALTAAQKQKPPVLVKPSAIKKSGPALPAVTPKPPQKTKPM